MLRALASGALRRSDLLAAGHLSAVTQNFTRHVQPLLDAGFVEMTQPDSPRSPTQRYRITDAGRRILDEGTRAD